MVPRAALGRSTAVLSALVALLVVLLAVVASQPQPPRTSTTTATMTVTSTAVETVTQMSTEEATTTVTQAGVAFTTIITKAASTASFTCTDSAPTGPFFLRVLSDSTMEPVPGANVTATNRPVICNGTLPLADNVTVLFTTGATEWYLLSSDGVDAAWSVTVKYDGQAYSLTENMNIISATCATLFLPSGRTNVTVYGYQSTCGPPPGST